MYRCYRMEYRPTQVLPFAHKSPSDLKNLTVRPCAPNIICLLKLQLTGFTVQTWAPIMVTCTKRLHRRDVSKDRNLTVWFSERGRNLPAGFYCHNILLQLQHSSRKAQSKPGTVWWTTFHASRSWVLIAYSFKDVLCSFFVVVKFISCSNFDFWGSVSDCWT